MTYEELLSNLTVFEKYINDNGVSQEIIDTLHENGFNDTQIQQMINFTSNFTQNFDKLIEFQKNLTNEFSEIGKKLNTSRDEIIAMSNDGVADIIKQSTTITYSNISINQNYEAFKRANIKVIPSTIQIEPGNTNQILIEISNLMGKTEPFNIQIQNQPSGWNIEYQQELNISGLAKAEIPINISIPRNPIETARVVPMTIIVSNTVVDFNSSILVTVKPYHEIGLFIIPEKQEIKSGGTATYSTNIKNLGNVKDTFSVNLKGEIPNLKHELEKKQITLQPGELGIIELNITIFENWASMRNQSYNYTLTVISSNQITKNSSNFNLSVISTPKSMMQYIISEISALQVKINNTLNGFVKNIILYQLNNSILHLNNSIEESNKRNYSKAIILDKLAKINLLISEIFVCIGNLVYQIDDISKYLISELHLIRDHITLVMGKLIDTTLSLQISQIEINISHFADNLYNYSSISFIDAILININLWQSADSLDLALINIAAGNINESFSYIQSSICILKETKLIVSILNLIGSINDNDSRQIKDLIQIQINELTILLNYQ